MSKRILLLCIVFVLLQKTSAQQINTENLWHELEMNKTDTGSFNIAVELYRYYQVIDLDSNIMAAKRVLNLGERKRFKVLEAYGCLCISYTFSRLGDTKQAQEYIHKASRINEMYYNKEIESRIYNAKGLLEINFEKKLAYYRKAISLRDDKSIAAGGYNLLLNPTRVFIEIKRYDSALHYLQRVHEITIKFNDTALYNFQSIQGQLYLAMKQYDIALVYFKRALNIGQTSGKTVILLTAYDDMRAFYDNLNQPDSAIMYAKIAYHYSKGNSNRKSRISEWLYKYYQKITLLSD